jgi:hypothetical protein
VQRFYRLVASNPTNTWDFLSQDARRQPPPRHDPAFLVAWQGLSVFDTYEAVRALALRLRPPWKHGEYIAVLEIPDDAPFICRGPDHKGHWQVYDADGGMIVERAADLLRTYVVTVIHGPSIATWTGSQ